MKKSSLFDLYMNYLLARGNDSLSKSIIFDIPYQLLRENYSDKELREDGCFFSSQAVAKQLLDDMEYYSVNDSVLDPCCGAGDLLLAYAMRLPRQKDISEEINLWSKNIHANDINPDFLCVAQLRLVLLAYFLHFNNKIKIKEILQGWRQYHFQNFTNINALMIPKEQISIIILNPPYQQAVSSRKIDWSRGKITMAALFLDYFCKTFPHAHIAAILPDVIRSGSRYKKLRQTLRAFDWNHCHIFGKFDNKTDVDVFTISNKKMKKTKTPSQRSKTIGSEFDVHVGPVVPHRDPQTGSIHYFLSAKNIEPFCEINTFSITMKSPRRAYKGPFIVIRRTSSPSDKIRCAASIINSPMPFLVENHLIIMVPKKGTLEKCRMAYKLLVSQKCSDILNKVIRCRHLTVSSIANLPLK